MSTDPPSAERALVPFAVEPREVPVIWGGDALVRRFGKRGDPFGTIGESWECWDENTALGGPYAGTTIAALREQLGHAFTGGVDPERTFPLLTKFIDARQPLSVQVHPDDAYAQRVEHQPNGKTECWVILDAEPDAELILGWARDVDREEYVRRVADGTLGDVLRRIAVHAGDVFYLPAGTVHAIGAGVVLFEAQQASDLTYRIFDWNRVGTDGKPRPLHTQKAADVLNYRAAHGGALSALAYDCDGVRHEALVADPRFLVERVAAGPGAAPIPLEGMPLVVTALEGALDVRAGATTIVLAPYETALVPAALGEAVLSALAAPTTVLTVAPCAPGNGAAERFARAGVDAGRSSAFLAQFAAPTPSESSAR
jgi:mannose-6-phosphate isomerase class I